jgi:hypothetical protein
VSLALLSLARKKASVAPSLAVSQVMEIVLHGTSFNSNFLAQAWKANKATFAGFVSFVANDCV